jgi:eukaryotic-like serine/threonine-protein kinase
MLNSYNSAELSFKLLKEIGQEGKNASAFVAHDKQLDAEIVIKKMLKDKLDVDTFFDESKILYLSSHPNVVQVLYACQDKDSIYIAMPYYRRGSLNALINSRYLTVREIVVLTCQIASGLHNIHSKKLIHFDVKPDNVLLSDRGEALLSDFGLSKRTGFDGQADQDHMYSKTRPPEALLGDSFSPLLDIYQLGLTLYRMCNGNVNFYEQFRKYSITPANIDRNAFRFDLHNGRFPDRSSFLEHIPEKLKKVVKKCLEPDPADRFNGAIDVANALADIDKNMLDWQYSVDAGDRTWRKQLVGREYLLLVRSDGSTTASKRLNSGIPSRIRNYCSKTVTSRAIRNFLSEY